MGVTTLYQPLVEITSTIGSWYNRHYRRKVKIQGGTHMDQEKIGKFIAICRKEEGLTQAQLAEKLNITDRAVSKWETGVSHS